MNEFEQLLLGMVKDIQKDVGEIKITQGRMDERLQSLERNKDDDECVQKRLRALESSTEVVKSGGGKGKATAITISLAGVGAVVWSIVKAITGAPGP